MTKTWMPGPAKYYACDAEFLPFRQNSFDIIIGNSVLHHFLNYESVLKCCLSIVREGGIVGFSEPTLEGFSLASYIVSLLVDDPIWTDRERIVINKYIHYPAVTSDRMKNDREKLKSFEDKHIFGIEDLQKTGLNIGYTNAYYANTRTPVHLGKELYAKVKRDLKMRDVDSEKMERFYHFFDKFSIYSAPLRGNAPFYFGYFIFHK